ncbi:MAG: hypothetical protein R3C27_16355 [Hyphomonadaceae bacterium]
MRRPALMLASSRLAEVDIDASSGGGVLAYGNPGAGDIDSSGGSFRRARQSLFRRGYNLLITAAAVVAVVGVGHVETWTAGPHWRLRRRSHSRRSGHWRWLSGGGHWLEANKVRTRIDDGTFVIRRTTAHSWRHAADRRFRPGNAAAGGEPRISRGSTHRCHRRNRQQHTLAASMAVNFVSGLRYG